MLTAWSIAVMEPSLEAKNVSYKKLFEQGFFRFSKDDLLLLDSVLALEHVVDLGKVVSTRGDGRGVTLGSVVLLEMGLLSEVAHLIVSLRGDSAAGLKTGRDAEDAGDLLNAAVDAERQ